MVGLLVVALLHTAVVSGHKFQKQASSVVHSFDQSLLSKLDSHLLAILILPCSRQAILHTV